MTSAELYEKAAALKAELVACQRREQALELELRATRSRIAKIAGVVWGRGGEYKSTVEAAEKAKREEEDAGKRKIYVGRYDAYVLHKVTEKSILLRNPGCTAITKYQHNGQPVGRWGDPLKPEDLSWILAEHAPKKGKRKCERPK